MHKDMIDTIEGAKQDLRDWAKDNPDETEPHDIIHELADNAVPVYNSDIMDWAAEDLDLALDTPELGPAFDGSPTPINIIAANIFEYIESELWEEWKSIEKEQADTQTQGD